LVGEDLEVPLSSRTAAEQFLHPRA